ncbi:hypothetical protein FLONG3_352 [Fusarium longipes]|uniref:Uncharacterized protein n=1 Tax=Fusarium longipes TaxID=694270 RepID=A0A395T9X7_9HYPO|nr:hypothetical protein FLONG3_352 [Fusarium longipes]
MCQAIVTHFTCIWCNDRWNSVKEDIICPEAKGPLEKGVFGGCGLISGVDKSIHDQMPHVDWESSWKRRMIIRDFRMSTLKLVPSYIRFSVPAHPDQYSPCIGGRM